MDKNLIANVWHSGFAQLHPVIIRPSGENENCIINDQLPSGQDGRCPPDVNLLGVFHLGKEEKRKVAYQTKDY